MKQTVAVESGGMKLHGVFYLAEGKQPMPTVLMLRGFPSHDGDMHLGQRMTEEGINVLTFFYRGTWKSEGYFNLQNAQEDIQAALEYLHRDEITQKYDVDKNQLVLGGLSFGGGMAPAYAARNPSIKRFFTIVGDDFAELSRAYEREPKYTEFVDNFLEEVKYPSGPIWYKGIGIMDDFIANRELYDLRLIAPALNDWDILLIGGWDDSIVTVEDKILHFYRALVDTGNQRVKIATFQDDHILAKVEEDVADLVIHWVKSPVY